MNNSQLKQAALKLGLQLVQAKLGQVLGDPSFMVYNPKANAAIPEGRVRTQTARIRPPKVVTAK